MTRNETRSNEVREAKTREVEEEYVFEEPDALHIPDTVKARFDADDMSLRYLVQTNHFLKPTLQPLDHQLVEEEADIQAVLEQLLLLVRNFVQQKRLPLDQTVPRLTFPVL